MKSLDCSKLALVWHRQCTVQIMTDAGFGPTSRLRASAWLWNSLIGGHGLAVILGLQPWPRDPGLGLQILALTTSLNITKTSYWKFKFVVIGGGGRILVYITWLNIIFSLKLPSCWSLLIALAQANKGTKQSFDIILIIILGRVNINGRPFCATELDSESAFFFPSSICMVICTGHAIQQWDQLKAERCRHSSNFNIMPIKSSKTIIVHESLEMALLVTFSFPHPTTAALWNLSCNYFHNVVLFCTSAAGVIHFINILASKYSLDQGLITIAAVTQCKLRSFLTVLQVSSWQGLSSMYTS